MVRLLTWLVVLLVGFALAQPASAQPADPLLEARQETALASDAVRRMQGFAARGEARGVRLAAQDYSRALERALDRIDAAVLHGRDVSTALNQVAQATQIHSQVLAGVWDRVPAEARPAIERAIIASQKGHNVAVNRLGQLGAGQVRSGPPAGPLSTGPGAAARGGPLGALGQGRGGAPPLVTGTARGRGGRP